MPTYDIEVTRDGGWWMSHNPPSTVTNSGPLPGEIEDMARDYIALVTETRFEDVRINIRR